MRVRLSILCIALLAACTYNEGVSEWQGPYLLRDQSWSIAREEIPGGRVCTAAAGEIEVTLQRKNGMVTPQVATTQLLEPRETYVVLVGGHRYETPEKWFGAAESRAIIEDFKKNRLVYTEWRRLFIDHRKATWRGMSNKIGLDGFAALYRECEKYIR